MMKWKYVVMGLGILIGVPLMVLAMLAPTRKQPMHSFELKYLSGAEAADILTTHLPPASIEGWSDHTVFLRGDNEDRNTAAELLKREDTPKPQVALRFQLIEANGFTGTDSAISRVESVLRGLFKFEGYRLIADAYIRTKANNAATQTFVGSDDVQYTLEVRVIDVLRREQKASCEISVDLLANGAKVLSTGVNLPDAQTAVLGTARPRGKKGALILVVTPEIR